MRITCLHWMALSLVWVFSLVFPSECYIREANQSRSISTQSHSMDRETLTILNIKLQPNRIRMPCVHVKETRLTSASTAPDPALDLKYHSFCNTHSDSIFNKQQGWESFGTSQLYSILEVSRFLILNQISIPYEHLDSSLLFYVTFLN